MRSESAVSFASARSEAEVDLERLGDLVPDPLYRVERGHRVLEDHGDLGAPERRSSLFDALRISAPVADRPGLGGAPAGEQSHDGPGQHGLARAGLAHDAERLPLFEGERDTLDRAQLSLGCGERHSEVVHHQQGINPSGVGLAGGPGCRPGTGGMVRPVVTA